MKFLKEMKAENDDLKVSLAGAKRELESMEKKYVLILFQCMFLQPFNNY